MRHLELFAGIGGFRRAMDLLTQDHIMNFHCVGYSEIDLKAVTTYCANFRPELDEEVAMGDIVEFTKNTENIENLPDFDLLTGGFPCQTFSMMGKQAGFNEDRGQMFFRIIDILAARRPRYVLLENVKNLKSHDKGNTFKVIWETLTQDLGYTCSYRIIDGQSWVPQHRERIVIVGFKNKIDFSLDDMILPPKGEIKLGSILHKTDGTEPRLPQDGDKYFDFENNKVLDKYTLTDNLWAYLQAYAQKHRSMGNGFGYGLVNENDIARTLSARYYKDGSEILISQGEGKNPRRLTPRECARLMGYPDDYVIPVSDTRAYKQFGNSVVVPLFHAVAEYIKPYLMEEIEKESAKVERIYAEKGIAI